MDSNRRPRHIRDIAHLYLSRRRRAPGPASLNVFVTSDGSNCFPAWHVANIAATLSARSMPVCVYDWSGLLPNVPFYMALGPDVYLHRGDEVHAAINSVSVTFSREQHSAPAGKNHASIIHLPPLSDPHVAACIDRIRRGWRGRRLAVLIHETDRSLVSSTAAFRRMRVERKFRLCVREGDESRTDGVDGDLGRVVRWRDLVADPLPAVVRRPHGDVARDFSAMCESFLSQLPSSRRHRNGATVADAR